MKDRDMVILIFDCLLVDYAYLNQNMHSEEFRSMVTKYNLLNQANVKPMVNTIVDKLYELNNLN